LTNNIIFADNAGTTRVSEQVLRSMLPFFGEVYGNPSSLHPKGFEASAALDAARAKIAQLLGATPREIFFTGSGTEAINWAIKGTAYAARKSDPEKNHIISTEFEHHATINSLKALERDGFEITLVKPSADGIISPERVAAALRPTTALVSVMAVNNEIGTIQPISELSAITRPRKIPFFTDAVQAAGNIPINVNDWDVDMLAISGHKIHAPKGIGVLYIRRGTKVRNFIDGGGQESGRRGGTENLPYIAGLATALEIATAKLCDLDRVRTLRERIIDELLRLPNTRLNGSRSGRVAGNANLSFYGAEGESLLLDLAAAGICVSTGSACAAQDLAASHVLLSIGVPVEWAHCSLRISLTHENTEEEADKIIAAVTKAVNRIRAISTL